MRIYKNQLQHAVLLLTFFLFLFTSCTEKKEREPVTIGISKGLPAEYYGHYSTWLTKADTGILWIDLYHVPLDSALILLEQCSGLLVTGGPDVYPGRYGQDADTVKCGEIDFYRDTLEFALLEKAKKNENAGTGHLQGSSDIQYFPGGKPLCGPSNRARYNSDAQV